MIAAAAMRTPPARSAAVAALITITVVAFAGCQGNEQSDRPMPTSRFDADLAFLRDHTTVIVLSDPGDPGGAQVVVAPQYQGRVLTSTTGGDDAPSFGWIGRAAISSRSRQPHMNVFGGEDRFWLGPEGGQFSLYFAKGDPFDLDHWQVPPDFDWGGWEVASRSSTSARFQKRMSLQNYSGTRFEMEVDRTVRLLSGGEIAMFLGDKPGDAVRTVAFESANTVSNIGSRGVAAGVRAGIRVDPGHVQPVPVHDDRHSLRRRIKPRSARSSTMRTSARCPPIDSSSNHR